MTSAHALEKDAFHGAVGIVVAHLSTCSLRTHGASQRKSLGIAVLDVLGQATFAKEVSAEDALIFVMFKANGAFELLHFALQKSDVGGLLGDAGGLLRDAGGLLRDAGGLPGMDCHRS